MSRSLKKGPFVDPKLAKKVAGLGAEDRTIIKTWARASTIPPEFVGKTINMPSVSHINELKLGDVVGSIFLDNLEDIEKLYVPVDFDLSKLKCKEETMHQIKKNVIFEDTLSQSNNKCRIIAIN